MKPDAAHEMPGQARALRAVAILPARLASTRLARKMLLRETGRYLFEHTALQVARTASIARVVIATDDEELRSAALACGLEALDTSPEHQSGSDRVHEAWSRLAAAGERADVVLNVQGDEPEIAPEDLERLIATFADPAVEMASLWGPLEDERDAQDSAVVKVVLDAHGDALYFSRAALPDTSHARPGARRAELRRHVGVYAFRPAALAEYCALPQGQLERQESLEQLRWLEAGRRLRIVRASRVPHGVDTADDYARFVARAAARADQGPEREREIGTSESEKDRVRS
jgi:3-deoxy-manno-octulosonate cytidylyltransferase (CMP-KDO synthetase)